jgi:hypothetical protein
MKSSNYLNCSSSDLNEKDITFKMSKFLQVKRIIIPSQFQKHTRLTIYKTRALPTLLDRSKSRAVRDEDKSRITLAKMRFMSRMAKYAWQDYKSNDDII